jgi:hypothetical protein
MGFIPSQVTEETGEHRARKQRKQRERLVFLKTEKTGE